MVPRRAAARRSVGFYPSRGVILGASWRETERSSEFSRESGHSGQTPRGVSRRYVRIFVRTFVRTFVRSFVRLTVSATDARPGYYLS